MVALVNLTTPMSATAPSRPGNAYSARWLEASDLGQETYSNKPNFGLPILSTPPSPYTSSVAQFLEREIDCQFAYAHDQCTVVYRQRYTSHHRGEGRGNDRYGLPSQESEFLAVLNVSSVEVLSVQGLALYISSSKDEHTTQ